MSAVAYVNGAYRPLSEAAVHIEDRGFQFGDAIYEVWGVRDGRLLDTEGHLARLNRSLRELKIARPMGDGPLMVVVREIMRRNRVRNGLVYLQVSRGQAARDHAFPQPSVKPTLVLTAKSLNPATYSKRYANGVSVVTTPEVRWARCDIKSVNLLPNVLAKEGARAAGALEAWFVDGDGYVTEGAASTAWIVDAKGRLRTPPLSDRILHGVTRAHVLKLAAERQIALLEEPFTPAEAQNAKEAFITSASNVCVPVVKIDGAPVGDGKPGPMAATLRDAYFGARTE
ncbi:MAG: D-amino-acid transaminase [Hyphomonadaceae bacterium]